MPAKPEYKKLTKGAALPGEQYQGKKPKPRRPGSVGLPGGISKPKPKPGPISNDPAPTPYKSLKQAFKKPGLQAGEKDAISRIAANREVSRKDARKIALNRTSKGLSIKGSVGPKGLGAKEPKGRVNLPPIDKSPLPKDPTDNTNYPTKPGPKPMPGGRPKLPPVEIPVKKIKAKVGK